MEENRFKKLRMELNPNEMKEYKAKDLSKELGISRPKISELEHGRTASLSELQAYHKFFNVPYEYLLGENDSRHYKNMAVSKEIGLSSEAIERIKKITQNKTLKRILNIFIEKYMYKLLLNISDGTYYMEIYNENIKNNLAATRESFANYKQSLNQTQDKTLEILQEVSEQTGHVIHLIIGDENIDYCKLKSGEIVREAVGEILYHWEK